MILEHNSRPYPAVYSGNSALWELHRVQFRRLASSTGARSREVADADVQRNDGQEREDQVRIEGRSACC